MPISDETTTKRAQIEYINYADIIKKAEAKQVINITPPWFLDNAHYPVRVGNALEVLHSGEEVFKSIRTAIKNAESSVDIVAWGFDPAIPLIREDPIYKQNVPFVETVKFPDDTEMKIDRVASNWRKEDSYGETIFQALRDNKNLRIRMIIWYASIAGPAHINSADNIVGIAGNTSHSSIGPTIKDSGLDKADFRGVGIPLRHRHPDATKYSEEWFDHVKKGDIKEHPYLDRLTVAFRSMPFVNPTEEDPFVGQELKSLEAIPTHHQKNIIVDFDLPEKRHGYMMGHNGVAYYWSQFPFVHRDPRAEMDITPYHDFSMKVHGSVLIDMNENFCDAWASRSPFSMTNRYGTKMGYTPRANDNEDAEALRAQRRTLYDSIIKTPAAGPADCQVVRTFPTTRLDLDGKVSQFGDPEKEIKDAYLQVTRHARHYIFIVNQYCQYPKLVRHIKHWWKQYRGNDKSKELYIFMGTCVPEKDGQVFRAEQMANELGVGVQFAGHYQLYDEDPKNPSNFDDAQIEDYAEGTLKAGRSSKGESYEATAQNIAVEEIKAMGIYPVFFKFYTPIPHDGTELVDKVAQQVYVHAKLMIQDDIVMTLGSTNLNTRSMAVDSEINLFTSDHAEARKLRKYLWESYCEEAEGNQFPNKIEHLEQNDLQKIYDRFVAISEENVTEIQRRQRIKGLIATFSDPRSIVATWNVRVC